MRGVLLIFLGALLAGLAFLFCCSSSDPQLVTTVSIELSIEKHDSIEKALASIVRIDWRDAGVSTGVIIGRRPIKDVEGFTQYFVLTAFHAIDNLEPAILSIGLHEVNMLCWADPTKSPKRIASEVETQVSIPAADILVVSFDSELDLHVMTLAPRMEIDERMHIGDDLYVIGCDSGNLPITRRGILASKRFIGLSSPFGDITRRRPDLYFCPSAPIWKGASGGPVVSSSGEMLGMLLRVGMDWTKFSLNVETEDIKINTKCWLQIPVFHIPTAIKATAIRTWLKQANSLHVLEDVR